MRGWKRDFKADFELEAVCLGDDCRLESSYFRSCAVYRRLA
jgi:hypothetical protein